MPSTVNVNHRSVVHAGSTGIATAFPDVCKTPTPAGPVPIPYPNIAMSSDTDGTANVKADGSSCMTKGANLRMSTGDEAGAAMGVVSNKIKGKAEFFMYSFDVKLEGKNACRLTDPMQQNMGSANSASPAHLQPMFPGIVISDQIQRKACNAAKKAAKEPKKKAGAGSGWGGSGVIAEHQGPIQEVVDAQQLKVIFRATKSICEPWIRKKYQPKPHCILAGTTIGGKVTVAEAALWLERHRLERLEAMEKTGTMAAFDARHGTRHHTYASASPSGIRGGRTASEFEGIVGSTVENIDRGRPLLANRKRGSFARNSYVNMYVTGDYDLQDIVVDRDTKCRRLLQTGAAFGSFQREVNKKMKWDGIQHGPQAQWVAQEGKDHAVASFSMPALLKAWLSSAPGTAIPEVPIAAGRTAPIIDKQLTVVTPRGAAPLANEQEVKDYLVCCGCRKPGRRVM